MTQSTVGSSTVLYAYDPTGARKKMSLGTAYSYYPNQYYTQTGTTTEKDIYANGTLIADISNKVGSTTTYWDHPDYLGSTNVVSNTAGLTTDNTTYYPFGALLQDQKNTAFTEGRKYIGQLYDGESNLEYLNARYYNPQQGQFLSQDPLFLSNPLKQNILNPQALNSYAYSTDNPITKSDPTGLFVTASGLVQKGDTLGSIASQINSVYGTSYTYQQLASANGISNPNVIYAGSYLGGYSRPSPSLGSSLSGAGSIFSGVSASQSGGSGFSFTSLPSHFADHGADFGAESQEEYSQMAESFLNNSLSNSNSALLKYDSTGNALRIYEPETNTFGSYNTQSYGAWTYYKPDPDVHGYATNMEYYESMDGESVSAEGAAELLGEAIEDFPI
jgi:RHS repeat-associated protein